jgi:hypothetical protein
MSNLNHTQQPQYTVDSTSYIYSNAGKDVPLAEYFLNFKFLNSEHQKSISAAAGKITTEIGEKSVHSKPPISLQYTDVVLFLLLGLLSLIAFVRISGKNYLNRIFTSIINFSYSNSFFKEKNLAYTLNNNVLMLVFYIASGLFLSVIAQHFEYPELVPGRWEQFLFYAIFTLVSVVIYKLVYRLLGLIVGYYTETSEFLFFFANSLKILGIAYVILLFGSFFTTNTGKSVFIYIGVILTILMFFVKFYRILVTFFRNRFSLYYMILYFCALEIIPVILLVKIFVLIRNEEISFINLLV